ncbi:MAG TPA: peptidoglycan editing factor PgeF [Dissulfurispiraceae bacterium]|nr:peptidoglycan editing factor PgeF [Dissulfurispiraceae bacterium]
MLDKIVVPPVFHSGHPKAFFTTRAFHCDAHGLAEFLAVPPVNIYMPIQKHTDKVMILDYDRGPKVADAVITGNTGIFIGVQVADCVPVLLFDKKQRVAGAIHAGWRGTAASILKKTIEMMSQRFFTSPPDIIMAIGPSIRGCCYEAGYEVMEPVVRASGEGDYYRAFGGKYYIDLAAANRQQAVSCGVSPEQIWFADECTFCTPGKYYSYRFAKGATGRQCGVIGIV